MSGALGYWLASGLSLASVLVLAVLAGQALTLQEREDARRSHAQMIERVAEGAAAFAREVPGGLGGRAAFPLPVPVASLSDLELPDDEDARAALLGSLAPGEAGRIALLEAHLNAPETDRLPWKWLLAQRGLAVGDVAEAERWLREIAGLPADDDRRLADGFPSKTAAALKLAGVLIRGNRSAEAQVAVRSVFRWSRPNGPIGEPREWLGMPGSLPVEIEADLQVLREGWTVGAHPPGWYFSSGRAMLILAESDGTNLYFCEDFAARLAAVLGRASGTDGDRRRLRDRPGSATVALSGLPGLYWDLSGIDGNGIGGSSDTVGGTRTSDGSRGRVRLGVAVAVALVGVSALLLLGLRREEERQLSVSQEAFFAQAAHDLKTPLATLRVLSETLSLGRAASPEKQQRYLEQIIAEVDRSAETVDAMLMAGRLGAGTLEPRFESVDARRVFERLLERFAPRLEGWQASVAASEAVFVHADPAMFERVGINLIENVLRHAAEGRILEISLVRGTGNHATIVIADRGQAGVGQESAAGGLFPTRSRLGLTLVDGIVKLHGGTWDMRERPGGGHLVELRWPLSNGA